MNTWLRFFVGTPQRFLGTFAVLGMITVVIFPGLLRTAVERLVYEITPVVGLVLVILVMFAGFRIMFGGFGGGKKS